MLISIEGVLKPNEVEEARLKLNNASWADGRHSAGYLSQGVKNNQQLPDDDPIAVKLGETILKALQNHPIFTAAALPLKVLPPLFNRYTDGESYGGHIDGAIRPVAGGQHRIRTDLSATLFLSNPDTYEGGELIVRDTFGEQTIKLSAGDMVLYPGTSIHQIKAVTSGVRLAAFFWIESMVRDNAQRETLFQLDKAIQHLGVDVPEHPSLVTLAGIYHNLLRFWANT
tara:strand:- start:7952 stop:8632 length:681 start_codon:yes stop_codon:yes gene_type:complete